MFYLLLPPSQTAKDLLHDAWAKLESARSLSVTVNKDFEEFPRLHTMRVWTKEGGYLRSEEEGVVDLGTPTGGWTFSPILKKFQVRRSLDKSFRYVNFSDLSIFRGDLSPIGNVTNTTWHKRRVLRIEVDGRSMTKEAKVFLYLAPDSHLPVGFTVNLGSVTQVRFFADIKLNPVIPSSQFAFKPPKDWKKVTAEVGGWK